MDGLTAIATERIGIVGGTFDPPHFAHLILAEHAREELNLTQVLFVPAGVPPHKDSTRTPVDHRLKMLELAIAGNAAFKISDVDITRPAPHYSVDMVKLLRLQYPDAHFHFVMGEDSFRDLPNWRDAEALIADGQTQLAVMCRPGAGNDSSEINAHMHADTLPRIAANTTILTSRMVEISSTDIVRRLREKKSVRYLLPDSVLDYIQQQQLYLG